MTDWFDHPHRASVESLPESSQWAIRDYFGISDDGTGIWRQTRSRDLWQADLALALLRLDDRAGVEHLLGKPILVCPPCLERRHESPPIAPPSPDDRVIHVVADDLLTTDSGREGWGEMRERLCAVRSGRTTVAQFLARGSTRRDLRLAAAEGWIVVAEREVRGAPPVMGGRREEHVAGCRT